MSMSRARRLAVTLAVTATLGLLWFAAVSYPLGRFFQIGGLGCFPEEGNVDALICTASGQWLVLALPMVGAAAGLVCAVVGWVQPHRRRWAWLAIGYAVALGAAGLGFLIAAGTSY